MHLYLDTTFGVTVGLLDEDFKWLYYTFSDEKKSSTIIHSQINQALSGASLEISKLSSVICVAGPGSYTGMRVSKGITDVLEWQGIEVYSFYQYDVPLLVDRSEGIWFSNAFKGEYFLHEFKGDKASQKLVEKSKALEKINDSDIPIFCLRNEEGENFISTQSLIHENSEMLFKKVVDRKMKRELFYYRGLDQEFSKAKAQ